MKAVIGKHLDFLGGCFGNCWQDTSSDAPLDEKSDDNSNDHEPEKDAVMEDQSSPSTDVENGESLVFTRSDDTIEGESSMMFDQDLGVLGQYGVMFAV